MMLRRSWVKFEMLWRVSKGVGEVRKVVVD